MAALIWCRCSCMGRRGVRGPLGGARSRSAEPARSASRSSRVTLRSDDWPRSHLRQRVVWTVRRRPRPMEATRSIWISKLRCADIRMTTRKREQNNPGRRRCQGEGDSYRLKDPDLGPHRARHGDTSMTRWPASRNRVVPFQGRWSLGCDGRDSGPPVDPGRSADGPARLGRAAHPWSYQSSRLAISAPCANDRSLA